MRVKLWSILSISHPIPVRPVPISISFFRSPGIQGKAYRFFDVVPLLAKSPDEPQRAKFGGHPDADGCWLWAEALYYDLTSQGILK